MPVRLAKMSNFYFIIIATAEKLLQTFACLAVVRQPPMPRPPQAKLQPISDVLVSQSKISWQTNQIIIYDLIVLVGGVL